MNSRQHYGKGTQPVPLQCVSLVSLDSRIGPRPVPHQAVIRRAGLLQHERQHRPAQLRGDPLEVEVLPYHTVLLPLRLLFKLLWIPVGLVFGAVGLAAGAVALPLILHVALIAGGALIVQTLHPPTVDAAQPYRDGWREGSWCGIDVEFQAPAPWYFRTVESWVRLFVDSGLRIESLREPLHPRTAAPLSLILVGERA